jgi:hypothetical protein
MFKKISYLVLLLCLVMGAQVFLGCDANSGDDGGDSIPVPENLKGKWVSTYLENYQITNTKFSSLVDGKGYTGDIVNAISDGDDAGYIIIKYTLNTTYPAAVGRYYAVHYKNLAASAVEVSGAYSSADLSDSAGGATGKATQAEAEAAYTVVNGYFGMYSACYKAGPAGYESPIVGTWSDGDASYPRVFQITEQTVAYSDTWTGMLIGDIVNVRDLEDGSGYITFKYTYAGLSPYPVGQYCVLYWENLDTDNGTADIGIASADWTPGDEGQLTQLKAEIEYTKGDSDDYYDMISCTKQ